MSLEIWVLNSLSLLSCGYIYYVYSKERLFFIPPCFPNCVENMYHSVKHNTTLRTSLRNSKLIKFIFVKFKMFFRHKCQLKFHIIFRNIKIHKCGTHIHYKFICCSMTMEGDAKSFQGAIQGIQAQSISCHDVVYMCQCVTIGIIIIIENRYYVCSITSLYNINALYTNILNVT